MFITENVLCTKVPNKQWGTDPKPWQDLISQRQHKSSTFSLIFLLSTMLLVESVLYSLICSLLRMDGDIYMCVCVTPSILLPMYAQSVLTKHPFMEVRGH